MDPIRFRLSRGPRSAGWLERVIRSVFPGEIPGRSRLELLGRRRGGDRVFRNGRRRFVTKVNHFYNGGAAAIRDTSGFGMDRDVNGARGIFLRALGDRPFLRGLSAQVASQTTLAPSNVVERLTVGRRRTAKKRTPSLGPQVKEVRLNTRQDSQFPAALIADLRRLNPWWAGNPAPPTPPSRRHLVERVRRRLDAGIAPIVAVRGPRQVGKTTVQLQIINDLLAEGVPPNNIMRVQFDDLTSTEGLIDPILRIADWLEENVATDTFNALAHQGQRAYLFVDEVQNIPGWSNQLKFLVDTTSLKVLLTGSSALRIEQGRDSLAGRLHTVEAAALSLTEIAKFRGLDGQSPFLPDNGLSNLLRKEFWQELVQHGLDHAQARDEAFRHFSERGGYPVAHNLTPTDWPLLADQLNETVIRRVLQHDMTATPDGQARDAALLDAVFRLACRYAGQAPSYQRLAEEARLALGQNVRPQQAGDYLQLLADTMLIRLVMPLEARLRRSRGNVKICLADHSLRASWLQELIPLDPDTLAAGPEFTTMAGHIAESAFGATASAIPGLDVAHQPEQGRNQEVDFVFNVGDRRIPIEVKYQRRIDQFRDTLGIRSFVEQAANRAPFGLLITQTDTPPMDDPRIVAMPLSTFMLLM